MATRATSLIRPLTGISSPRPIRKGHLAKPDPACQHRQRDDHEIEHVVQPVDLDVAWAAALALDLRRLAIPGETIDHIEQRQQDAAHEQHRQQHGFQRPEKVDALEEAEKERRISSGVSEPPMLETRKMKNTKIWMS